jgi:hypothetical protein
VLLGESYETVKLAICYFMFGGILHKHLIRLGAIETDTRVNIVIVMKPGLGKTSIKNFIRDLMKGIAKVRLPSTLYPEELIGKTIHRRIKGTDRVFKKPGYFGDLFIVVDEALQWVLRKDSQADRLWSFINTALDTYTKNTIEKELVDDLSEEKLEYLAECSIMIFIQPARIPYRFVSRGILRRFVPLIIDVPRKEKEKAVRERPRIIQPGSEDFDAAKTNLMLLKDLEIEWSFTDEAKEALANHTLSLVRMMEHHTSKTVRDFGQIMHHTCENRLAAMAAILAASGTVYGKRLEDFPAKPQATFEEEPRHLAKVTITAEILNLAAKHLRLFMESSVEFIELWISPDYESIPVQATREFRALTILKERKCTSLESSSLSINEYLKELAKQFSCSIETARTVYKRLKKKGVIDSKQTGQKTSKVWVTQRGLDFLHNSAQGASTFDQ